MPRRIKEFGLVSHLKQLTLRRMKIEMLESGERAVEVSETDVGVSPLFLEDLMGTFLVMASLLGVAGIVAVMEWLWPRQK